MSEYRNHEARRVLTSAHYTKHVLAMTVEDLYSKSEIAKELAFRDFQIEKLRAALTSCAEQFDAYAEHHKEKMEDSLNGLVYREDAEVKYRRNLLLAFNARKAME